VGKYVLSKQEPARARWQLNDPTINPDGTLLSIEDANSRSRERLQADRSHVPAAHPESSGFAHEPPDVSRKLNTSPGSNPSLASMTTQDSDPLLLEKLTRDDLENQALSKKIYICKGC